MISALPQLNYLDESPVADKDRRLAAAFIRVSVTGGGSSRVPASVWMGRGQGKGTGKARARK